MGLKDLHLKFKAFRLGRPLIGDAKKRKNGHGFGNKATWMAPVLHGYHVVEDRSFLRGESDEELKLDSVVVQREQIEELEVWFFGVSDARIGDDVTKYMQAHFFDKKPKKSQLRRKSKEAMRKAYLSSRWKMREVEKADEIQRVGSASALVINGEKLVIANMGDYRAVVCRDGEAYQVNRKHQQGTTRRHWSRKFFPGVTPEINVALEIFPNAMPSLTHISGLIRMPKVRTAAAKQSKGSDFAIGDEKIDWDTEFVILASTGIWEVMKHQEAVNLIRHIEDPQEAAECLAKEALTRMSRGNISCLVIRFE